MQAQSYEQGTVVFGINCLLHILKALSAKSVLEHAVIAAAGGSNGDEYGIPYWPDR